MTTQKQNKTKKNMLIKEFVMICDFTLPKKLMKRVFRQVTPHDMTLTLQGKDSKRKP